MKYAVLQTGGKQYKVSEGSVIEVDKLKVEVGSPYVFDSVLLYALDGEVKVGQPLLTNVSIVAKILEQKRGEKIRVAKFKAKARYRKVQGFRAELTKVEIEEISIKDQKLKSKDTDKE